LWNWNWVGRFVLPGQLQFPELINACGRITEKSRDVTESNFSPSAQAARSSQQKIAFSANRPYLFV
jgi:hypothetical protein